MAGRIIVLDENVINRIAAGEVVERPVSVVKELVENSIDAGAANIRIDIENGGKKLIRVRDDGSAMSHDDAFLALERHATSKLQTEQDLVGIATMGFRGEALAGIAAVSRLRLATFDGKEDGGTEIVIEGGVLRKSDRIGMGRGTLIEVRNLFYNVPVRRKFLKGHQVESGHVHEFVTRVALAFPKIGLIYSEDGKVKIDAAPVNSTFERIHAMYSKDVRDNLVEVDYSLDRIVLKGYVARPPYARSDMRSVLTFVNGRAVRDRVINSAVNRAFANLMERGRYPLAILFIEAPPDEVDVNVHPQKAEVRFVHAGTVYNLILDGVHEALMGAPFRLPPSPRELMPGMKFSDTTRPPREEPRAPEIKPPPLPAAPAAPAPDPIPRMQVEPAPTQEPGKYADLGILGSLPGSFVLLYDDQDLIVMDHHAAHERVVFEELMRSDRERSRFQSQDLLIPKVLAYSPAEAKALSAYLGLLKEAGFSVEEFGEREFVVRALPTWLKNTDLEGVFEELIGVMLDIGLQGDPGRMKEELLKSLACAAAVKESKTMQPEEIRALLKRLDEIGAPEVCPHGRPMVVRIPLNDIRRRMGRKAR